MYREHTPIERYRLAGREVFVKRDDLFAQPPAPPLAKLRGLRILLKQLYERGERLVGCWDTRVSKLTQGLAAACREFRGMRAIVSYPTKTGVPEPEAIRVAAELGAEVVPIPGGRISICFAKARRHVTERGGVMLPFGLECAEAVTGIAQEAATVPPMALRGTLVLCCGSGVTLAGLLTGLPVLPERIIGLSSGRSLAKIEACLRRHVETLPDMLELHPAVMPYAQTPDRSCPFPTHPNYDLKAWDFLVKNLDQLRDPILFWNIGA